MSRVLVPVAQATAPFYVGVDVGGTSIKIGVVDDLGRLLGFERIPTEPQRPGAEAMPRVAAALERLLRREGIERSQLRGLGLGSPGTMDIPAGLLLDPPNLPGWCHFAIRDTLARETGLRVAFANDAGAAAYGEFWIGCGHDVESLVLLTLGTGVGGGIIVHGRSIDGQHSHGAECGHIIVDSRADARVCSCGQPGHLEAYSSATAVVKRMAEALEAGRPSSLRNAVAAGAELSALLLAEHAAGGDPLSLELVDETAYWLGVGMTTLVHTIDPAVVALGGAMDFGGAGTPLGERFLAAILAEFRRRAFPVLAERTRLRFASLGGDAGLFGAAGIARVEFGSR